MTKIVNDADGSVWVWLVRDGRDEIRVFSEGVWKVLPPELLAGGRLRRIDSDVRGGMLTILISRTDPNRIRRFTSDLTAHEISTSSGERQIERVWSDRFGTRARGVNGRIALSKRKCIQVPCFRNSALSTDLVFHEGISLSSSFEDSGFESSGAVGDFARRDLFEKSETVFHDLHRGHRSAGHRRP